MNQLTARKLNQDEIDLACQLLYDVYTSEMKWEPPSGNPSGFRVTDIAGRKALTDIFTAASDWFGVFDKGDLVGCIRLLRPVEGRLEIENYRKVPSAQHVNHGAIREVNRFALRPSYRAGVAGVHLIREVIRHAKRDKVDSIITAVSMPEPAGLCRKLGFIDVGLAPFKYAAGDSREVSLYALDCRQIASLEKILTFCDELIGV